MDIRQNAAMLEENILGYTQKAGVSREDITVVAVSKTCGQDEVMQAYGAGFRHFGENKVQEFVEKKEGLPGDISWNFIGRLQRNKVKYIMNNVWLLHSLDRRPLMQKLKDECAKRNATLDALVQINIAREEAKAGFDLEDIPRFLEEEAENGLVRIRGLMTIGPLAGEEKRVRQVFAQAKKLFDKYAGQMQGFRYLSMGMTGDYGPAILEGANMLRIGSAIFGSRRYT